MHFYLKPNKRGRGTAVLQGFTPLNTTADSVVSLLSIKRCCSSVPPYDGTEQISRLASLATRKVKHGWRKRLLFKGIPTSTRYDSLCRLSSDKAQIKKATGLNQPLITDRKTPMINEKKFDIKSQHMVKGRGRYGDGGGLSTAAPYAIRTSMFQSSFLAVSSLGCIFLSLCVSMMPPLRIPRLNTLWAGTWFLGVV